MHIAVDDLSLAVQDESPRHGYLPGVVPVKPLKIDSEFFVEFSQAVRQGVNQAKLRGHSVTQVSQHPESQLVLFDHLLGILRQLGRNPNQGSTCILDIENDILKSCQLFVEIRSPDTPVKADHQRPIRQQVRCADQIVILIAKRKLWCAISDFQNTVPDIGRQ